MEEMTKMLKQLKSQLVQQDILFNQEISKIKDAEKRNKLVTLYNAMKSSEKPLDYLPEITALLNERTDNK
jgi:hypothetical protein